MEHSDKYEATGYNYSETNIIHDIRKLALSDPSEDPNTINQHMKRLIVLFLTAISVLSMMAEDFEFRGIYYHITSSSSRTCEVISGPNASYGERYVGDITIPESVNYNGKSYKVTGIADAAFHYCSSLRSVDLPSTIEYIGETAFYTAGFSQINIPGSVKTIGSQAFCSCRELSAVRFEDSVEPIELGNSVFQSCSISSLYIGRDISGNYPYYDPSCIESVTFGSSVYRIPNIFVNCTKLCFIEIPEGVVEISNNAFSGCTNLGNIALPNSLAKIGASAFSGCKPLSSITLPEHISWIGSDAFKGCSALTTVRSEASTPPEIFEDTFDDNVYTQASLYVPMGAVQLYSNSSGWKQFISITESKSGEKCAAPTISYDNGQLHIVTDTPGAECVTMISDDDVTTHYIAEIPLSATYNISAYSHKEGFEDSDLTYATLCWLNGVLDTNGVENVVSDIQRRPILIRCHNGEVSIEGTLEGENIDVFNIEGAKLASHIASENNTSFRIDCKAGTVIILKINGFSIKSLMR